MRTEQVGPADTATQILDVAERLVQVRGFNGFSYADVATELTINKAALHYHFPVKQNWGKLSSSGTRPVSLKRWRQWRPEPPMLRPDSMSMLTCSSTCCEVSACVSAA